MSECAFFAYCCLVIGAQIAVPAYFAFKQRDKTPKRPS